MKKMKITWKRITCIVGCLLFMSASVSLKASETVTVFDDMGVAADNLVEQLRQSFHYDRFTEVELGQLTLMDTEQNRDLYSSSFASEFLKFVRSELKKRTNEVLVVKGTRSMQSLTRGAANFGGPSWQMTEADAIMRGTYELVDSCDCIKVTMWLELASGRDASGRKNVFLKKPAPMDSAAEHYYVPQNKPVVDKQLTATQQFVKENQAFDITLVPDKASQIYRNGEQMGLFFITEKDCYLRVLYIDNNNQVCPMFPTARDYSQKPGFTGRMKAKEVHKLHDPNEYQVVGPPFGSERMVAICATQPWYSKKDIVSRDTDCRSEAIPNVQVLEEYRGMAVNNSSTNVSTFVLPVTTIF